MLKRIGTENSADAKRIPFLLFIVFLVVSAYCIRPIIKRPQSSYNSSQLNQIVSREGDIERTDYVDEKGNVTIAANYGYATKIVTRTDCGEIEEYYDNKGERVIRSLGYYGIFREYDDNGNNICTTYLDLEGKPVITSQGYAKEQKEFNSDKQLTSVKYLDKDNNPVLTSIYGYGKLNEYDENGRVCKITYIDSLGQPMMTDKGYAIVTRFYYHTDGLDNGKVEYEYYFDKEGTPVSLSLGEYGIHNSYDENGQVSKVTYIDEHGAPLITTKGYTTVVRTYQADNSVFSEQYYDINGKPFRLLEGQYGIKKIGGHTVYLNAKGNIQFNIRNLVYNHPGIAILFASVVVLISAVSNRNTNIFFLIVYIAIIIYFTLLYREVGDSEANFDLFWSYRGFFTDSTLRGDIIKNVWLFIPFGSILYHLWPKRKILLVPAALSIVIEIIQYISGTGLCEFDDMISNSLGGILGYGMGVLLEEIVKCYLVSWRLRRE